ncbi:MAG: thioesterase [Chlorobi bacterium]|nr:thioesterase [Chlorobiota bacterium]
MREILLGHQFTMRVRVTDAMTATFFGSTIHRVYATFALIEHAEYASRQAILPFLDPEDDAVGAAVTVEHSAPAIVGDVVTVAAIIAEVDGRTIVCRFTVTNGGQPLATGTQTQRVVNKARLKQKIAEMYERGSDH